MTIQMKGNVNILQHARSTVKVSRTRVDYKSLPWQPDQKSDRRFRFILYAMLLATLAAGVIVPFLEVTVPDITPKKKKEPPLTRVVIEIKEEKKVEPEKKIEKPKKVEQKKPKPKKTPQKKPPEKKAKNSGLLKMASDLSALKDAVNINVSRNNTLSNAVSSKATSSSNSLKTRANQSDDTAVETSIAVADLGEALGAKDGVVLSGINDGIGDAAGASGGSSQSSTTGSLNERSDSNIRSVMDRNKSTIYSIYNRALRRQADLEGKFVVRLVIEPSGKVSSATVVDSELNNKALEKKLLTRIRLINFGAKNVVQTTIDYTLNFFPS